jgi:hypothetical protein
MLVSTCAFLQSNQDIPMQLIEQIESYMIRRNTHMRSLLIEYARPEHASVMASLFDRGQQESRFNLQVLTANANGILLKLPARLSGMFDLKIMDGKQHISKRIAIQ